MRIRKTWDLEADPRQRAFEATVQHRRHQLLNNLAAVQPVRGLITGAGARTEERAVRHLRAVPGRGVVQRDREPRVILGMVHWLGVAVIGVRTGREAAHPVHHQGVAGHLRFMSSVQTSKDPPYSSFQSGFRYTSRLRRRSRYISLCWLKSAWMPRYPPVFVRWPPAPCNTDPASDFRCRSFPQGTSESPANSAPRRPRGHTAAAARGCRMSSDALAGSCVPGLSRPSSKPLHAPSRPPPAGGNRRCRCSGTACRTGIERHRSCRLPAPV